MNDLSHILRTAEVRDEVLASIDQDRLVESLRRDRVDPDDARRAVESLHGGLEAPIPAATEAIIRKVGRPVLYIQDDDVSDAEIARKITLELWQKRFADGLGRLVPRIPSVGRVELRGHPRLSWVGTAWLVAPRVMVTNRHVAVTFARQADDGFTFRLDPRGRAIKAWIDTYEEHERPAETEYRVQSVLHIEEEPGPDMAFLRVEPRDFVEDRDLPDWIDLSLDEPQPDQVVGVIGYAAWDGGRNDRDVMDDIFERTYEVKRLHPGEFMEVHEDHVTHDCSTLGGNSGSVVLDFATGKAVALHFAGRYEGRNYAVKSSAIAAKLDDLKIEWRRDRPDTTACGQVAET